MCVYSNIGDYGRQFWNPAPTPTSPYIQYVERTPTPEEWAAFKELLEKAKKFDELTNQPDCKDPDKTDWMAAMEERVRRLEHEMGSHDTDCDCQEYAEGGCDCDEECGGCN